MNVETNKKAGNKDRSMLHEHKLDNDILETPTPVSSASAPSTPKKTSLGFFVDRIDNNEQAELDVLLTRVSALLK